MASKQYASEIRTGEACSSRPEASHEEIDRETTAARLKATTRAQVRKVDADRRRLHSALGDEERRVAFGLFLALEEIHARES